MMTRISESVTCLSNLLQIIQRKWPFHRINEWKALDMKKKIPKHRGIEKKIEAT